MRHRLYDKVAPYCHRRSVHQSPVSYTHLLITTASSLHDIGKIRIPEEILNKPGRLTDEEFKIMETHSELGAAIIKDMDFPQDHLLVHTAWEICRWNHER